LSLSYDTSERVVTLLVDEDLYALDAIYGTAYLFVDRCYVLLGRPKERHVSVRLRAKGEATEETLEALAGEFSNELLNQVLRMRIGESTKKIREYTLAKAFFSQPRQATIDALLAELDAEELEEDPLEIEVPWESA
jgi:His-Xaa-Ser system protein HxsD